MAARFWVGGTGNWNDTGHWSTLSGGGSGAAVPTSADDVTFDSNSGVGTVTIDAPAGQCLTLLMNRTGLTILDTAGLTVTNTLTLTLGVFNTNGQSESWGAFSSSGAGARTLTLGASAITITTPSITAWSTTNTMTMSANTATITFNASNQTFSHSGNMQGASIVSTGATTFTVSSAPLGIKDFTRTGTAVKTDSLTLSSGFAITGTLTLGGNTVQGLNRLLIQVTNPGVTTGRTITAPAVVINGDVDFTDTVITTSGGGSPTWSNPSAAYIGNGGNNSAVITANANASSTQTWATTGTGSWSDITKWTSRVPLPQDDVVFSSAFAASPTITADMPRLGRSIDWSASSGAVSWQPASLSSGGTIYGSLTLRSGITIVTNLNALICAGRGSTNTLTWAGVNLQQHSLQITCGGGTYTILDNFLNVGAINVTNGSLIASGLTLSTWQFQSSQSGQTRFIDIRNSYIPIGNTAATSVINMIASGLTFLADGSTFDLTDTGSATKTVAGAGLKYGTIKYVTTGTGNLTITGANIIDILLVETTAGKTVTFPAGVTTTITQGLTLQGPAGGALSVVSSSPGTQAAINAQCPAVTRTINATLSADIAINQCPQVVQPARSVAFFA